MGQFLIDSLGMLTNIATQNTETVGDLKLATTPDVSSLPPDMAARLTDLLPEIHKPWLDSDGFNHLKYPDNYFLAYGLIQRGEPVAHPYTYIETVLRDFTRGGEFVEDLEDGGCQGIQGRWPQAFAVQRDDHHRVHQVAERSTLRFRQGGSFCKIPASTPSFSQN